MEKADQAVDNILKRYKLSISDSGEVIFHDDKHKTLRNIAIEHMGRAYTLGSLIYDIPKDKRTPEQEEQIKHLYGEMNVVKTIMHSVDYDISKW